MKRKIVSMILTLCLVFSCISGLSFIPAKADSVVSSGAGLKLNANSVKLTDTPDSSNILKIKSKQIIAQVIKPGMTDEEKEKAIHDYLVLNVSYDEYNYLHNTISCSDENPKGAILNGTAVCGGYAEAFKYLMDLINIPCLCVSGFVTGEGHEWNMVELGGVWVQVDVTWDDLDNGTISYGCFNISDSDMASGRTWDRSAYLFALTDC